MKSLQNNNPLSKPEKIVLTGYRMITILKLLISGAKSTDEINTIFKNDSYIKKSVSNDMICLYINTLRQIGCDISRPSKSNNYKYVLNSHPFEFKISNKNSESITFILESLIRTDNWEFLIDVCELFKETQALSSKDSDTNFLRVISDILKIDKNLIKKLDYYCKKERLLLLEYNSTSSELKKIKIIANKLFLENSKLYLWGYNQDLQEMQYLRIDRIKDIKLISIKDVKVENKNLRTAKYKLINESARNFTPDENQKIIEKKENEIIIEEILTNKFKFIQKALLYADECIISEPSEIKEEIIQTLKELLSTYG